MAARSRSRSPKALSHVEIVEAATASVRDFCVKHGIPESHGLSHALRVLAHVDQALAQSLAIIPPSRALSIRLAALLHDVDDRKYFPDGPEGEYPNAKQIMREAGAGPREVQDATSMIRWVSCSKNGNSVPPDAIREPELLWPRWADRLEATGEVGVVRCWQYAREKGDPLSVASTPRPRSEAEVWKLATPERFEKYQSSGGKSDSMMDHYYDKLLRVARPPAELLCNPYFTTEMDKRVAPLVEICLLFGESGQIPLDKLNAFEVRMDCREC